MRYGPGQHGGRPFHVKPFHVKKTPPHRSSALAGREGGIGVLPHLTAAQRHTANKLVGGYERHSNASASAGNLGHSLDRLGHVYKHNPVYRNRVVGHRGLLGAVEDLVKMQDPIAIEQTLAKTVRHPLASRSATGLNAGVVVGGPEGFRLGRIKLPDELAPEQKLAASLPAARKAYKEQQPLRSAERAQRFGKARVAGEQAGHGEAGYYAELGQMKGKLPTVSFDALREGHVSQEHFDQLMTRIATHPALQHGEKLSGRRALIEARDFGKPPPPHAQLIWQKAFGDARAKAMTPRENHWIMDLLTFPRAIMSTADLSRTLRQDLTAIHQEPRLAGKAFAAQVRYFRSKDAYHREMAQIEQRPNYERMQTGKLALTEMGGDLEHRDENFMSQIAEHVPIMAGSGRAYIGGGNVLRADMFDKQIVRAEKAGQDINDPKLLRSIAKRINSATGRGDYGPKLQRYAPTANAFMYSPRLIKSRLDQLNPVWYKNLDPVSRREALKGVARLSATMAASLYGAHLLGAQLQGDPRSSDFGKVRFGNLRVDPWGGFQQYVRAGSQIASGKTISTTTGKTEHLGHTFAGSTQFDILKNFVASKAAPVPSFVYSYLNRKDYAGNKFNLPQAVYSKMIPLLWQDVYSVYKDKGSAGLAAIIYGVGGVGLGVQDYAPKQKKPKTAANPFLRAQKKKSSSSNPFLPGSSGSGSSSSNPFLP